ncbi:aminodeoxychorismate synthase component I [Amycolatopsis sp. NBC_00345]|uniref:aminodeoxychorismate synthase component I n=1 Tax=Amycolatopsis sp. NBC_00345 TaxID=2975955 RepID=UPI002E257867
MNRTAAALAAPTRRAPAPVVRTLLIDNYDSYTYNLAQQLAVANGAEPVVVTNDSLSWADIAALDIDNIVISPGPGRPECREDFQVCEEILRDCRIPVLGVCLGHQGMAVAYGGRTVPAPTVMHGRLSRIQHDGELFTDLPQDFPAVRYHSLVVAEPVPDGLVVTARADDGTVMGLEAVDRPFYGVQFHPESVLTSHGSKIIERFRDLTIAWWQRQEAIEPRAVTRPRAAVHRGARPGAAETRPAESDVFPVRPLIEEVSGPFDAEVVFRSLRGSGPAVWLDSAAPGIGTGRFSYLTAGAGPLSEDVRYRAGTRVVERQRAGRPDFEVLPDTGIFDFLAERLAEFRCAAADVPFDFIGGYVGWIGYECNADVRGQKVRTAATPDAALFFADRLVVIDHHHDTAYLVALAGTGHEDAARDWLARTSKVLTALRGESSAPPVPPPAQHKLAAQPDRDRGQYLDDIAKCQEYLRTGDTYEVCLTNQFRMPAAEDSFEVYRRLRRGNPAPFAAFLDFGTTQVCSSSPERFLRVGKDGWVEAKPIKGTARRHPDPEQDAEQAAGLAADPKERAENLMIVDLLRNDLGRVCRVGSVEVPVLMAIESFQTVHQMVSTVRGRMKPDLTAAECAKAVFPGGSMTGAPKVRTVQIIDDLENAPRGVYSGSIGYFGCDGATDLNIVIRTIVRQDDEFSVGAGGAITILSDAEQEWQEILLKAGAVLEAVNARVVEEAPR